MKPIVECWRRFFQPLAVCVLACAIAPAQASASPVRIVGSDLPGLEFSKALYRVAGQEGIRLALAFDGTKAGVAELREGRAAAALLVVAPDVRPVLADYEVKRVGSYVVYVWAGAECPLEHVTFEQLAAIYGAGPGTAMPRWREVGRSGEGSEAVVVALAPETGEGLTFEFFRHTVLRGNAVRKTVGRFGDSAEAARELARVPGAVAVAGRRPAAAGVRVLAVSGAKDEAAVAPSPDAVRSGSYPLQVPLELVVRRDAPAEARKILAVIFGDEATAILEQADVVPVTPAERGQRLAELTGR